MPSFPNYSLCNHCEMRTACKSNFSHYFNTDKKEGSVILKYSGNKPLNLKGFQAHLTLISLYCFFLQLQAETCKAFLFLFGVWFSFFFFSFHSFPIDVHLFSWNTSRIACLVIYLTFIWNQRYLVHMLFKLIFGTCYINPSALGIFFVLYSRY